MNIFLDTANATELRDICSIVPGDVSLEVVAADLEGMLKEGKELAQLAPNVVVKCPLTRDGLEAVKHFWNKFGAAI